MGRTAIPFSFETLIYTDRSVMDSAIYVKEAKTTIALLEDGRIDPSRLITSTVLLKYAIEPGFKKLLENKEDSIKILLQVPQWWP